MVSVGVPMPELCFFMSSSEPLLFHAQFLVHFVEIQFFVAFFVKL